MQRFTGYQAPIKQTLLYRKYFSFFTEEPALKENTTSKIGGIFIKKVIL
jgi:hypothetical protein